MQNTSFLNGRSSPRRRARWCSRARSTSSPRTAYWAYNTETQHITARGRKEAARTTRALCTHGFYVAVERVQSQQPADSVVCRSTSTSHGACTTSSFGFRTHGGRELCCKRAQQWRHVSVPRQQSRRLRVNVSSPTVRRRRKWTIRPRTLPHSHTQPPSLVPTLSLTPTSTPFEPCAPIRPWAGDEQRPVFWPPLW